jgi:hypothetical protein
MVMQVYVGILEGLYLWCLISRRCAGSMLVQCVSLVDAILAYILERLGRPLRWKQSDCMIDTAIQWDKMHALKFVQGVGGFSRSDSEDSASEDSGWCSNY